MQRGRMFDEMCSVQWRVLMRTQLDDFLIHFFFLAEGEEGEHMLVAHKAAGAGLRDNLRVLNLYSQLNNSWCIFGGLRKSKEAYWVNVGSASSGDNMQQIAGISYMTDIIYGPCQITPICIFNCSTDTKLGVTDAVCYKKLLLLLNPVRNGVWPVAALHSFGVALQRHVSRPYSLVYHCPSSQPVQSVHIKQSHLTLHVLLYSTASGGKGSNGPRAVCSLSKSDPEERCGILSFHCRFHPRYLLARTRPFPPNRFVLQHAPFLGWQFRRSPWFVE